MAKICIIEDSDKDLVKKYGSLKGSSHEVRVVFVNPTLSTPNIEWLKGSLERDGFKEVVFYKGEPSEADIPQADIYFCDGLGGECYDFADRLGKDKTFFYTNSNIINETAPGRGYKLAHDLEKILKSL